ncbi:hypothetical protein A6P54_02555 [Bacillus sp. MKU004]|nr:hypothetical protein A6P54_02555 [Bacillus sp. MKU004]
MEKIYFSGVKEKVKSILEVELISTQENFINNLLKFMSKITNYEEEESKINPHIIITKNLKTLTKQISNKYILPVKSGEITGGNLDNCMKSLLPFCNLGWCVFIDINEEYIEYGLIRSFSGPRGLTLTENLLLNGTNHIMMEIQVTKNSEILLKGVQGSELVIDFKLYDHTEEQENSLLLTNMVEDVTNQIEDRQDKKTLQQVFMKLFKIVQNKIHGSILMVVDSNFKPTEDIKDGIWLSKPINLSSAALDCTGKASDIYLSEKYYSLTGLLIEMMNFDGITVINSEGCILGYNVFLNKSLTDALNVSGGARKRTALSLLRLENDSILGVYFQSQDGNTFYERKSEHV